MAQLCTLEALTVVFVSLYSNGEKVLTGCVGMPRHSGMPVNYLSLALVQMYTVFTRV